MENTNWLNQTLERPLFPDLLWSRPENKRQAGKLLIIGGNRFSFAAAAGAYGAATEAGAGAIRVILPQSLKKVVSQIFPETEFAPETPSGSFSKMALETMLDAAGWSDGVLLAGDFGRNSETAILLEKFILKFDGQITISHDAADYFLTKNSSLMQRPNSILVINLGKLQKLTANNRPSAPVLHSMNLYALTDLLKDWSSSFGLCLLTKHSDVFIAASGGIISTTRGRSDNTWQVSLGAYAATWCMQHPDKTLEAVTCAVYEFAKRAAGKTD